MKHFFHKAQTLFETKVSTRLKKFLMLASLLSLLAVSAFVTVYIQSQAAKSSHQTAGSDLEAALPSQAEIEESPEIKKGREIMREVEKTADGELERILAHSFKSADSVKGSVHYDLHDVSDYSNLLLINWQSSQGVATLIQSVDFPLDTSIKLRVADDKFLDELDISDVQDFFEQLCEADIVATGQKSSLLLVGPQSARMFSCTHTRQSGSYAEEINLN